MGGASVSFLVIGGQKCATTTLFHHLRQHPQVYMPPQKELNFFARPVLYARGEAWYERSFASAPPDAIRGEASPLYLACGSAVPRIRDMLPQVRLVALLRNPVDRAYSHYRMAVRRGLEPQPFGACIREQARRCELPPDPEDSERDYLALGAYGRALAGYLHCFDRRQILVELTEDLAREPARVMRSISAFIGADPGFAFPELGRVHHAGGSARLPRRVTRGLKRTLKQLRPLLGENRARAVDFWLETRANLRAEPDAGPCAEDRAFLADYYASDVDELSRILGRRPSWPDFA